MKNFPFTYRLVHKATEAASLNGIRTGSALVMNEGAKKVYDKAGQALVKRLGPQPDYCRLFWPRRSGASYPRPCQGQDGSTRV